MLAASLSKNKYQTPVLRFCKVLHFGCSTVSFLFAWLIFRCCPLSSLQEPEELRYGLYAVVVYAFLLLFFNRVYNSYLLGYFRTGTIVCFQLLSQFFSVCVIYLLSALSWLQLRSPVAFGWMLLFDGLFDWIWSYSVSRLFFKIVPRKSSILLFGDYAVGKEEDKILEKPIGRLYSIDKKMFCTAAVLPEVICELKHFDALFAVGLSPDCMSVLSQYCANNHICGFFNPSVGEIILHGSYHIQSFHNSFFYVSEKVDKPEFFFLKRLFDILFAAIGLIVCSPLMLVTAISIMVYDGGPAIYKQPRLTRGGKVFTLYKFRSMCVNAEKNGKPILSTGRNDDRITPIGRFIRAIRIDELPQLLNIMKGDMTFIGPRPERPEVAAHYGEVLPEFKLRLQVKAGLTGYAQVYGKYNTSPEQKLKFDLMYINNMSLLTDLQLLFATVGVLFNRESTEGYQNKDYRYLCRKKKQ